MKSCSPLGVALALMVSAAMLDAQCNGGRPGLGIGGAPESGTPPGEPTGPGVPGNGTDRTRDQAITAPDGKADTPPSDPASKPGTGPTTGGGRVRAGPRGGMAPVYTRGKSSRERLRIRWDYPTPPGEQRLDRESALAEIRGKDMRPLLVLRECPGCRGTDNALLSRKLDNEKTVLMTRWFHCVRLTNRVMEENHPFHALFAGIDPPHLFAASWDGAAVVPFDGRQPQRTLWRGLTRILRAEYRRDPQQAIRSWLRVLNEFDTVDSQEQPLRAKIYQAEFKHGKSSSQLRGMRKELARLQEKRKRLEAKEKKIFDLGLIRAEKKESGLLEKLRK